MGTKKSLKLKRIRKCRFTNPKRQGLNKPNLLYLLKPAITKNDIYEIDKAENEVEALQDKEVSKGHVQKCQRTRLEMSKGHV